MAWYFKPRWGWHGVTSQNRIRSLTGGHPMSKVINATFALSFLGVLLVRWVPRIPLWWRGEWILRLQADMTWGSIFCTNLFSLHKSRKPRFPPWRWMSWRFWITSFCIGSWAVVRNWRRRLPKGYEPGFDWFDLYSRHTNRPPISGH